MVDDSLVRLLLEVIVAACLLGAAAFADAAWGLARRR
jgi:hypothetical protein